MTIRRLLSVTAICSLSVSAVFAPAAETIVWTAQAPVASLTNAAGATLPNDWYALNTWYRWGGIAVSSPAENSLIISGGTQDPSGGNTLGLTCSSSASNVWLRYSISDIAIHAEGYRSFSGPRIVDGERSTPMLGGSPGTLEPGLYLINVAQTYATFPVGNPLLRLDCTGMQVGMQGLQLVTDPDLSLIINAAATDVDVVVILNAPALEVGVKLMDADHQALAIGGKSELNLKSTDRLTWRATATLPIHKDAKPWTPSALVFKAQPIPVKGGARFPALFTTNSVALGK